MPGPLTPKSTMRIAKRIARSSICSRRDAERLIQQGVVKLNGVLVSSPAIDVTPQDVISINGENYPCSRELVLLSLISFLEN